MPNTLNNLALIYCYESVKLYSGLNWYVENLLFKCSMHIGSFNYGTRTRHTINMCLNTCDQFSVRPYVLLSYRHHSVGVLDYFRSYNVVDA